MRRAPIPRRVFISHTREFRDYPSDRSFIALAEAAITRAGDAVTDMHYFAAQDQRPADYCIARVEESQLYVGVIGFRYGSPVATEHPTSHTELEFEVATRLRLPRLLYLLDETAEVPIGLFMDSKYAEAQERFRRSLVHDESLVVSRFRTPQELHILIYHSLVESREGPVSPSRIRILLIDDDEPALTLTSRFLELEPGFEVVGTLTNGSEAAAVVSRLRPDVVLMDVAMPGLDGLEATALISQTSPETNVLIVSAHGNSLYVEEAMTAGARGYVTKPFIPSELVEHIVQVARGHIVFSNGVARELVRFFSSCPDCRAMRG